MNSNQSLSQLTPDATIGQIIHANNEAGKLLASIGVSLSKHRGETLQSVCQQQNWSESEVLDWVKKHTERTNGDTQHHPAVSEPSQPDINRLVHWTELLDRDFITPIQYLLEELKQSFPRVLTIHGNQYTWLKNIKSHFGQFRENLGMYFEFERKKFFPLIKQLSTSKKKNLNHGVIQNIDCSIGIIQRDQDRLQRQMNTIRIKSNDLDNPRNACFTHRIQNKNFSILFGKLEKQFQIESGDLLPAIQKELQAKK
ncbi:hypothetical protein G3570_00590 [Balneolaceae bacterium YR4-1]|uniref:Uncharacterized protein n=1 Tax=Halalkalibaculum roseum TaxID=2709311 RepID=A0A6M1SQW5_9BACT|nr:hypothetical protein [Halalkalibaculum roseum]NGP75112.1 hypothetical protein [Halalkalibaculum roseum]